MTRVPPTSTVYAFLADSFAQGRLDLLLDPPAQLAAVEDPYDPAVRTGIDVSMDASYYRGRYYVYWGPTPAVAALAWRSVFRQPLGDAPIALLAAGTAFLFSALSVLRLGRLSFPGLPTWLIAVSLAAVGFAHPVLWILDFPAIYEAAVASGQAFLLAGVYFAIPAIAGLGANRKALALAGTLWGLAIASRLTLIPAVGAFILAASVGVGLWRRGFTAPRARLGDLGFLLLPLVVVAVLLGLYNYGRFGDITETGFRYQLMPDVDYTRLVETGEMFNPKYVPVNAAYYTVAPVSVGEGFPYLRPVYGIRPGEGTFITEGVPPGHLVENATGVLVAVPFVLFSGVIVAAGLRRSPDGASRGKSVLGKAHGGTSDSAIRVGLAFVAAGIVTAIPLLTYRYVANRFELDVVPLFMLAACLGAWQLYRASRTTALGAASVTFVIVLTAGWTVVFGILLGASRP
jgi:hypothetical protein